MSGSSVPLKIFSGTSNPAFAHAICKALQCPLGEISIQRFADGEVDVQIMENVRGCDVFVIQSTCTPVNEHLMELFLIMDALRRASVHRITAVIPYYGYARQDRKTKPRVPISAALAAQLIEAAGANRVLSVDLHCGQVQGFFRIPVDNLYASPVFLRDLLKRHRDLNDVVVVSPDAGGLERAERFRQLLEGEILEPVGVAIINKKREQANKVSSMELVGSVTGADVIIVDDIVDTAGTLCKAAELLKEKGAKRVFACVTHPLLSGNAISKIENSVIDRLVVVDTIPVQVPKEPCPHCGSTTGGASSSSSTAPSLHSNNHSDSHQLGTSPKEGGLTDAARSMNASNGSLGISSSPGTAHSSVLFHAAPGATNMSNLSLGGGSGGAPPVFSRIRQISVAPLVAEAIRRVHNSESVSGLFL